MMGLQSILHEPWKPVPRPQLISWLIFYAGFLGYAFSAHGGFLFIDCANLVVHEGGHNLFGWFGPALGLWGGTLFQWLVPFLLAAYFFTERQIMDAKSSNPGADPESGPRAGINQQRHGREEKNLVEAPRLEERDTERQREQRRKRPEEQHHRAPCREPEPAAAKHEYLFCFRWRGHAPAGHSSTACATIAPCANETGSRDCRRAIPLEGVFFLSI